MDEERRADHLRNISGLLESLGEDPSREGLEQTPDRYLKALEFWTSGYSQRPEDVLKCFLDGSEKVDEMIFVGGVPCFSICEHHLAPFFGYAHIAYIPSTGIVGLSKLPRLLEVFARRLQVQERLCNQVADALVAHLDPVGVGVMIHARHMCMESRGVQKIGTVTVTSALRGAIKTEPAARAEFLSMVQTTMQGIQSL